VSQLFCLYIVNYIIATNYLCSYIITGYIVVEALRDVVFTCKESPKALYIIFFQMTRYFLNYEFQNAKEELQKDHNEGAAQNLGTFKRLKHTSSREKSKREIETLVTVVKYKNKPWRGRNYEDDRLVAARVRVPWNRKLNRVPVPEEKLAHHSRGEGLSGDGIKTNFHQKKLKKHEVDIEFSLEQAARTELLLPEESG
jgi:hypothetical protein